MKDFIVHVVDSTCYEVSAETQEEAIQQAWEWFNERKPTFTIEEKS